MNEITDSTVLSAQHSDVTILYNIVESDNKMEHKSFKSIKLKTRFINDIPYTSIFVVKNHKVVAITNRVSLAIIEYNKI